MEKYLQLNNDLLNKYENTGVIDRDKDRESTKRYFLDVLIPKMRAYIDHEDRISYLVQEGYYEPEVLELYSLDFIKSLYEQAYAYNFRFPTFMSAKKFYDSYAMKSRDGKQILERYEDRIVILALYFAKGNEARARQYVDAVMLAYQPATPTMLNAGKAARGEFVSCFILALDDSTNAIAEVTGYCMELSRLGGGVAINATDLRCASDPIKGQVGAARGVMPNMRILEDVFAAFNQLGQRSGSGAVYLNVFHGDIEEFINAKKPNADEKYRLATLSTGVIIPRIFYDLAERDAQMALFSPYDIYRVYGKRLSEISMTEMYYELLENPQIRKVKYVNTNELLNDILKTQFESGYPFIMNDDNTNENNPLKAIGRIKNMNLCTEIAQIAEVSVITDKDKPNKYGFDISCNLGSIDIHNACTLIENFETFVQVAVDMLTEVSDTTNIVNVPTVAKGNHLMHAIGLGQMNLHGHLVSQGILYGSEDAIRFADSFSEAVDYYSLLASVNIAKEKGETFYRYEDSEYASGAYVKKKIKLHVDPTPLARKAMGNVPVVTVDMWRELQALIDQYGVYNGYRCAVAPTGSISYIRSCTASVAPVNQRVEVRDYQDSRTIYIMPHLSEKTEHLYKTAYETNPLRMIDMYAAMQKHVDQAISMTLYVTDEWTTEMLARVHIYAERKGIKSIYYTRQKLTKQKKIEKLAKLKPYMSQEEFSNVEECESCSI